jgi:signal peptidase II
LPHKILIMTTERKSLVLIVFILLCDQVLKIWVKTHMIIGQKHMIIGDWFIVHFIENNGMAFGMEIPTEFGKIILSVFRIIAIIGIGLYLRYLIKNKVQLGLIICISLVFAGAIGNIIDSAFYGMVFNESYYETATLFPAEGGYSSFLHGKVVDMLYFPIIEARFPDWFPFWGSERFIFFRPVFNIADASITTGVISILVFQRKFFRR